MHPDLHPDLFLRVYQQQERELTQRLLRRLAVQGRPAARPRVHLRHGHLRPHRAH